MRIRNKIIAGVLLMAMLLPTTVFAKTETYNTPNTTSGDTDKKSECEVTADVHYAYYISLPAALTLEPMDVTKNIKKYEDMFGMSESEVLDDFDYDDDLVCWYQVKAKTKEGGLGGKYIKVMPIENAEAYIDMWNLDGSEEIDHYIQNRALSYDYDDEGDYYYTDLYLYGEDDNWHCMSDSIRQKRIYFGDTASDKVVKVDSSKWSSIDGLVEFYNYNFHGMYKGAFDFVYGLVDSIE